MRMSFMAAGATCSLQLSPDAGLAQAAQDRGFSELVRQCKLAQRDASFDLVFIPRVLNALFLSAIAATIVCYQIVNFHRYVVDAVVWRLCAGPVRPALGLSG